MPRAGCAGQAAACAGEERWERHAQPPRRRHAAGRERRATLEHLRRVLGLGAVAAVLQGQHARRGTGRGSLDMPRSPGSVCTATHGVAIDVLCANELAPRARPRERQVEQPVVGAWGH